MIPDHIPEDELTCVMCGTPLQGADRRWIDGEAWCPTCLAERGPDEQAVERMLIEMLSAAADADETVGDVDLKGARVTTFEEASLLTRDRGVVLRLPGGREFQITIVQSR